MPAARLSFFKAALFISDFIIIIIIILFGKYIRTELLLLWAYIIVYVSCNPKADDLLQMIYNCTNLNQTT